MLPDDPPAGEKRLTRQQAISAHCKDCIYDPYEPGTWVQQVTRCPSHDCRIWPYRPRTRSKKGLQDPPGEGSAGSEG
jgi:hypothetical protein